MKNILIALVAVLLVVGCTPMSNITLHTQPPGGKVTVEGVTGEIANGGSIELPEGQYTLLAEKRGFAGTRRQLVVDGNTDQVVTIPLGTGFSRVQVSTLPPGELVLVKETGQVVWGGETISLPPDTYTFILKKNGYKESTVVQKIDGLAEFQVTVPRGKGFGVITVTAQPSGAVVRVNGEEAGKVPLTMEIMEGEYEITITGRGYYPQTKKIAVKAGSTEKVAVDLKKIPTTGKVSIVTHPAGGTVFFEGKEAGAGTAELGPLTFNTYQVQGEIRKNSLERLFGKASFQVSRAGQQVVTLYLDQQQYLFEQQWVPIADAMEQEERRYRRLRTPKAVQLKVKLDEKGYKALKSETGLAAVLQEILRVGDRVVFLNSGKKTTVWKRYNQLTPEFNLEVAELQGQGQALSAWKEDKPETSVTIRSNEQVLADVAVASHTARNKPPLLHLAGDQLAGNPLEVFRSTVDGDLTLVVIGGAKLRVNGQAVPGDVGILVERIPAGNTPIKLSWQSAPAELLVVSDQPVALKDPQPASLMMQEKKLVRLVDGMQVENVLRLSSGPEYEGCQQKLLEATGPLSSQIDLSMDEIGPHAMPGIYTRSWIVRYPSRTGISQRQLTTEYQVGAELLEGASDQFLRRTNEE